MKYDIEPGNVVVIGDKFKTDLIPAKELGMKTIHMQWGRGKVFLPQKGDVDYSVEALHEVVSIVRGLEK